VKGAQFKAASEITDFRPAASFRTLRPKKMERVINYSEIKEPCPVGALNISTKGSTKSRTPFFFKGILADRLAAQGGGRDIHRPKRSDRGGGMGRQ
jgi:hypothetical protein